MKNSTVVILILIMAGLFFFVIRPQYGEMTTLRAESAQYKYILNNISSLAEKRDSLLVKYNAIPEQEVNRLNRVLPDHIDTVRLAVDLDAIASKYGIALKSIQSVQNKPDESTTIVQEAPVLAHEVATVSFQFVSTYENFRRFITDIEKSLRIIDIKTVTFSTGNSNLYEYEVSFDTYWLK